MYLVETQSVEQDTSNTSQAYKSVICGHVQKVKYNGTGF